MGYLPIEFGARWPRNPVAAAELEALATGMFADPKNEEVLAEVAQLDTAMGLLVEELRPAVDQ